MHLSYKPDLTPSEYYRLLSRAYDFATKKFVSKEAYEIRLSQFFTNRNEDFYENGITLATSF